jgi:murein L,D-transpeptidase YafK
MLVRFAALGLAGLLAACASQIPKDLKPVPRELVIAMHELDMEETAPIFIRIFKEDSRLEVWRQTRSGPYALLKTYDICQWSGELGPKKVEGDRQAPEGFYTVTPAQMNPNSSYYLSFNIGYPNDFDRSLGRTGSNLMVHGACSSAGCYSMTDESAGEIFALARDSFRGGQRAFQIQAFPFRMTAENMARHRDNANMSFWRMLKVGYDSFDITHLPPKVDVCDHQYVFNADAGTATFNAAATCPAYKVPEEIAVALAERQATDNAKYAALVTAIKAEEQRTGVRTVEATTKPPQPEPARPSLLSRLGIGGRNDAQAAAAPATSAPSVATSAPLALTPPPQPAAPPAVLDSEPAPAATAAVKPASDPAAGSDPIGTFIQRKFWWDDTAADPAAPAGASG